jgi:hypothetical protein
MVAFADVKSVAVKLRVLPSFPSDVSGDDSIVVTQENGEFTISSDYSRLIEASSFPSPSDSFVKGYNPEIGFHRISYAALTLGATDAAATATASAGAAHTSSLSAASSAAEALSVASSLPAITPNTMLVDNAAGTIRQPKTFAQVRPLLGLDYPVIDAYWEGVASTNTAAQNAAALASILANRIPDEGGTIFIRGQIPFDAALDLSNRRNVRIIGNSNKNSGAGSPSRLVWQGTGSGNAVNAEGSLACGFDRCDLINQNGNTSFIGRLLNFENSNHGFFNNALLTLGAIADASVIGLYLDGTVGHVFDRAQFGGKGKHVVGQQTLGFANCITFRDCSFHPIDDYSVWYPSEQWVFDRGYVQACTGDGVGRFLIGSADHRFLSLTVKSMGMYDVTNDTTQTVWLAGLNGTTLRVEDCQLGMGDTGYGILLQSVQGLFIEGNRIMGGATSSLVGFDATASGDPPSNYGRIWANGVGNTNLLASFTGANDQIDIDFNYNIGGGSGVLTVQKPFNGPTYTPSASKSMWRDTAASQVIKVVP